MLITTVGKKLDMSRPTLTARGRGVASEQAFLGQSASPRSRSARRDALCAMSRFSPSSFSCTDVSRSRRRISRLSSSTWRASGCRCMRRQPRRQAACRTPRGKKLHTRVACASVSHLRVVQEVCVAKDQLPHFAAQRVLRARRLRGMAHRRASACSAGSTRQPEARPGARRAVLQRRDSAATVCARRCCTRLRRQGVNALVQVDHGARQAARDRACGQRQQASEDSGRGCGRGCLPRSSSCCGAADVIIARAHSTAAPPLALFICCSACARLCPCSAAPPPLPAAAPSPLPPLRPPQP